MLDTMFRRVLGILGLVNRFRLDLGTLLVSHIFFLHKACAVEWAELVGHPLI